MMKMKIERGTEMENKKLRKLIHHINELERIWQDVLESFDQAVEDDSKLPNEFAEEYPFEKSFDEYIVPLYEWRTSLEEYEKKCKREDDKKRIINNMKELYYDEDREFIPDDESIWSLLEERPIEVIYNLLETLKDREKRYDE